MTRTASGRLPAELGDQMTPAVRAFVASLFARIDQLRAEVRDLRQQLARASARVTPQNSSVPPSTQHPHAKPTPNRARSREARGGQPGRPKHTRPRLPADECAQVVPCVPPTCRACRAPLTGADPAPLRHQVWDLPEIRPVVREYQRHRLTCACGTTTCGPTGIGSGSAWRPSSLRGRRGTALWRWSDYAKGPEPALLSGQAPGTFGQWGPIPPRR